MSRALLLRGDYGGACERALEAARYLQLIRLLRTYDPPTPEDKREAAE